MPELIPNTFIPFLTEPNEIIWDPLAGSCITASIAERLGRRWIMNERSLTYLQGAAQRFQGNPSLRTYFHELAA